MSIGYDLKSLDKAQDCAFFGWMYFSYKRSYSAGISNKIFDEYIKSISNRVGIEVDLVVRDDKFDELLNEVQRVSGNNKADWFVIAIQAGITLFSAMLDNYDEQINNLKLKISKSGMTYASMVNLINSIDKIKYSEEHDVNDGARIVVENLLDLAISWENTMSKNNDIYNFYGTAGAVGRNSKVEKFDIQTANLEILSNELSQVIGAIKIQNGDSKAIELAKIAADDGDKSGVIDHLKSAGKHTLKLAEKIGTSVAAKAISKALDL